MKTTASEFDRDVDGILDGIIETGIPVEIEHKGKVSRVEIVGRPSKLANLEPHPDYLVGDAEDLVHVDWSSEWKP